MARIRFLHHKETPLAGVPDEQWPAPVLSVARMCVVPEPAHRIDVAAARSELLKAVKEVCGVEALAAKERSFTVVRRDDGCLQLRHLPRRRDFWRIHRMEAMA